MRGFTLLICSFFLLAAHAETPRAVVAYDAKKAFRHLKLINAEAAWKISKGEGVVIAVIDSGVNYNHPDLKNNILINENEIPGNGIDDDQNGYIDDVRGWDFLSDDNDPMDTDRSHGTATAGVAASAKNGVAPKAKILALRTMDEIGSGNLSDVAEAIHYAISRNVDIINLSMGAMHVDPEMDQAIRMAESKNILVVVAAGNSGLECSLSKNAGCDYPATSGRANIISVAATEIDSSFKLATYSNFGTRIDVAAPAGKQGDGILAPAAGSGGKSYFYYNGTSAAAPVVAGLAALIKSAHPNLSMQEWKRLLVEPGFSAPALKNKIKSGKVIQLDRSLKPGL